MTAHVQAWVRGIRPNFGWGQYDGKAIYFSESASDLQPVLFIDYALEGDTTPPATVADLTPSNVTTTSVTLTWTAPGDDGLTGTAASYDIRYSTVPHYRRKLGAGHPGCGRSHAPSRRHDPESGRLRTGQ